MVDKKVSNMKRPLTFLSTCSALALAAAVVAGARIHTAGPTHEQAAHAGPIADDSDKKALKIRRVIAVSATGGSKVFTDTPLPLNIDPKTGVGGAVLWSTPVKPQLDVGAAEAPKPTLSFPPPPGETRFVLLDLAPGAVVELHATDTIDHFVLLEGEIQLYLEQGPPTTLHPGDTVVLLGARHKWANKTNKTAKGIVTAIGVAR
jgi:quercetin dioxygenase-like cupin family protein